MKRSVHFSIPEPCHENWDQMTPNEPGRFCGACQKTVIDFSAMSDQELLAYMAKATTLLCGNFAPDQLNRSMVAQTARRSYGFRYFWRTLVSGFLLMSQGVAAQERKTLATTCTVVGRSQAALEQDVQRLSHDPAWRQRLSDAVRNRLNATSRLIEGAVKDARTNLPIAHASITIPGVGTVAAANEAGAFTLPDLTFKDSVVLEISAVGYDKQVYTVKRNEAALPDFMLLPTSAHMDEVVVQGYGSRRGCGKLGGVSHLIRVSRLELVQRNFNDLWPGKRSVNVYPNPAIAGSGVKVEMNIKTTGEYKLELLDAGGRLVHVQSLQVTQPSQVLNLATQVSWSKGIYWVRIAGLSDKKMYHAKLVLQ